MERYNVRISLHGASPTIYDMLGDAMTRMGGAGFVETASGRLRRLRPGEYVFRSGLGAQGFLQHMETVVRAIWINSGIRVTGGGETCSSGAEPIPDPPSEESQREYASV